jgi:glycerophosphoryl diester phosphodiesterase
MEKETQAALAERGLGADILFSSFRPTILRRLREADPNARLALLTSPRDPNPNLGSALARAAELACEALNPHWSQLEPALVERSHEAGLGVNVYTVDEVPAMRRMLDLGVDGLFTNFPDRLRALLDV